MMDVIMLLGAWFISSFAAALVIGPVLRWLDDEGL